MIKNLKSIMESYRTRIKDGKMDDINLAEMVARMNYSIFIEHEKLIEKFPEKKKEILKTCEVLGRKFHSIHLGMTGKNPLLDEITEDVKVFLEEFNIPEYMLK